LFRVGSFEGAALLGEVHFWTMIAGWKSLDDEPAMMLFGVLEDAAF
jgi:hypothetical protein